MDVLKWAGQCNETIQGALRRRTKKGFHLPRDFRRFVGTKCSVGRCSLFTAKDRRNGGGSVTRTVKRTYAHISGVYTMCADNKEVVWHHIIISDQP